MSYDIKDHSEMSESNADRFRVLLKELGQLLVDTLDYLIDSGVETKLDPIALAVVVRMIDDHNPSELMSTFIEGSKEHWDKIRRRDIDFLKGNFRVILSKCPPSMVDGWGTLLRRNEIPEGTMTSIWDYLNALVKLASANRN